MALRSGAAQEPETIKAPEDRDVLLEIRDYLRRMVWLLEGIAEQDSADVADEATADTE